MKPILRVRREVFLPAHVDAIVTRRAAQGARTKSQVVTDAVLLLNALLAGTMEPSSLVATVQAQYGIGVSPNESAR